MDKRWNWLRAWMCIASGVLMLAANGAWADPPSGVVRLAYASGEVSFLPAGATDWVQANVNRPLWTGDRLWTGTDSRAELQMGKSALRVAPGTSVSVIAFDDRIEQYEVNQGTVRLRVRSMDRDDKIEVDTPNLAFTIREPGDYRVDVDAEATTVAVYRGAADAYGTQNSYAITAGMRIRFAGTDLGDYQPVSLARTDAFDGWVGTRVGLEERSNSARYVAPDMVGYADLDTHGTWRDVPSYGSVWTPTSVATDWAPYRYGRWVWVDPWGWTWVDDAPWGFAPFHYGRWAFLDSRWSWVPGPRTVRPVYAPALVAFVGGPNFGVSLALGAGAGVAWFALAPGEVYRPAYHASRDYFTRVNVTNTVVNVTQVTNIYNNPTRTDVRYANFARANAVTAVPTQVFVEARPVQRAAVKVDSQALQRASVVVAPTQVAPAKASIVGGEAAAHAQPAPAVTGRAVIAKNAPPPPPPSIEQRHQALQREPGKPLEQADLQKLSPAAAGARPNVKVVQPAAPPKPLPSSVARASEGGAGNQALRDSGAPPAPIAQPPRGGPPVTAEKNGQPPGRGRSETSMRAEPVPPAQVAPPRTMPAPAARTEEPPRPPQAATVRPAPTPAPGGPPAKGEPLRRPDAPRTQPEQVTPPVQATPAPPPARPELSKAQPQPQPQPQPQAQRQTPPQAQPQVPPQAQRQTPPQAQPTPRPETAQAPRPAPRDAVEPPRQQAAVPAPASRTPEVRPPPNAAPRTPEPAVSRGGPEKGKENGKEKNKDDKN